jgi:hypothetical protein
MLKCFIGVDYWSDKTYTEFKKHFKGLIAPLEMKEQYDLLKKESKSK